jgi:16S rRNA (uracil1498-N3)-methyltransferase
MAHPFFYIENLETASVVLDEDTSKHVVQVLRMKRGEQLLVTDGKGKKAVAMIEDDNRKRCSVNILSHETEPQRSNRTAIAISLVKNSSRFEWFLEKATEIGVSEIIPLLCERTEKEKFRHDRMKSIVVSAMLQSQQSWMPVLHEPTDFDMVMKENGYGKKFIAHCVPGDKASLHTERDPSSSSLILIGPEGDFTNHEIAFALDKGFLPVTLGSTRLRTETAGMVAAALLCV